MKRLFLIIFLISACVRVNAQCGPAGKLTLKSLADVGSFQPLYCSCPNMVVEGSLRVAGSDTICLQPLAGIKEITRDFALVCHA